MARTWMNGVLSAVFGKTDTSHWLAVSELMKQSFGEIIIDTPVEGGNTRVFFKKQVLVGDSDSITAERTQDGTCTVDMDEPIGFGKNSYVAIIDLWEKLISLQPHENILLFVGKQEGLEYTEYTSFRFKNGRFSGVTAYKDCPPNRHPIIQKYFQDHRHDALIARCEDEFFGARKPT